MTPKAILLATALSVAPFAAFAQTETTTDTTTTDTTATDTTATDGAAATDGTMATEGTMATDGAMATTDAAAMPAAAPTPEQMQAAMTEKAAFAERAASGGMFEVQSSEVALQKSQSDEVKAFAQKMIDDHTAANEKLMAAAQEDGVTPPAALMPDHQALVDQLNGLEAEAFDAAYMAAQKGSHDESVALFEGYSTGGEEGALKAFATETLPTLQAHQGEAGEMHSM